MIRRMRRGRRVLGPRADRGHRLLPGWLGTLLMVLMSAPAWAATAFSIEHRETQFDVYRLEKGEEQALRLFWKRPDGTPYASLYALRQDLEARGQQLAFAVNGGIYSREMTPLGLYIQDGETLAPLNRGGGGGNFFLKPNGIFYITDQGAQVVLADTYQPASRVLQAIQSGPMLVIKGELHPRFIPDYESRYVRNGVGCGPRGSGGLCDLRWRSQFPRLRHPVQGPPRLPQRPLS
jgi:uncharacterized protein YigE (DUF2233 family)